MATTPNYGWTTPDDTDLVKDGALAIRTLGDEIDNTVYSNVGGMTLISTTALSGATVSITSIPQTYKDLKLVFRNVRPATDNAKFRIRLNQDSNSNRHTASGSSSATDAFGAAQIDLAIDIDNGTSSGLTIATIEDYTNTSTWKLIDIIGLSNNATTATSVNFYSFRGAYNQTAAISSFDLFMSAGNITSGSLLLYGVK